MAARAILRAESWAAATEVLLITVSYDGTPTAMRIARMINVTSMSTSVKARRGPRTREKIRECAPRLMDFTVCGDHQ
jgi:hypothetical protein